MNARGKTARFLGAKHNFLVVLAVAIASAFLWILLGNILAGTPTPLDALSSPLPSPQKLVSDLDEVLVTTNAARSGEVITYVLVLSGTGSLTTVFLTDTVGVNGSIVPGSASASAGSLPVVSGNTLTWNGTVGATDLVTITFRVQLVTTLNTLQITNAFQVGDGGNLGTSNVVTTTFGPYHAFIPVVRKPAYIYVPIVLGSGS